MTNSLAKKDLDLMSKEQLVYKCIVDQLRIVDLEEQNKFVTTRYSRLVNFVLTGREGELLKIKEFIFRLGGGGC